MDYIGRFENLQEDFNKVASVIGLEDSELPNLLKYSYDYYTNHYDSKTIYKLYDLFKEEIKYFKFEYGE